MSGGGFMSLAYMAELGAVINLAYLELHSFRYLGEARKYVNETEQALKSEAVSKNGNHSLFIDLYKRVTELFSDDRTQRNAAWYIQKKDGKKVYFNWCSGYFYNRFNEERDRTWSTRYLCIAVAIIVLITLISQMASEEWLASREASIVWWGLFVALFLSIAIPAVFILMGRTLNKRAKQIMNDIREQKNQLAQSTFDVVLAAAKV